MMIIIGQMVCYARGATVHIAATQLLRGHQLASGCLHQRRASKENSPLLLHNNRLIGHRRHIGATSSAGAHYRRNLRNIARRHIGLIKKDTTKMLAAGKYLVLPRQIGTTGIHQIDTG